MNLQAFKKLAKQTGTVVVVTDRDGHQWLMSGGNMYALNALKIEESAVPELLDLNTKELGQIHIGSAGMAMEHISIYPTFEECELAYMATVRVDERELLVLEYDGRALFVDTNKIKPMGGENPQRYTARMGNGELVCIAAYRDVTAGALVRREADAEGIMESLRRIGALEA